MNRSSISGNAETMKVLRTYEDELFKALRKRINTEVEPILTPIAGEINSQVTSQLKSQMPGMFHNGRTGWSGVSLNARVSVKPRELVFIEGKGRSGGLDNQFGFEYAELAGIERRPPRPVSKGWGISTVGYHSYIYNGQGKAFNSKLTRSFGRPGRFLWIRVLKRKPQIEQKVMEIAEDLGVKLTRKLATSVSNSVTEVK